MALDLAKMRAKLQDSESGGKGDNVFWRPTISLLKLWWTSEQTEVVIIRVVMERSLLGTT